MKIDVLISTMNVYTEKENHKLINKMHIKTNSITISQVKKYTNKEVIDSANKLFIFNEKGLSKSRNRAISKSTADICVIADDDIEYVDNYEEIIQQAYEKNTDADIILFKINDKNENRKNAQIKRKKINFINTMRISSNQITFKRNSILKKIKFDEEFGSGSRYFYGEDAIMIRDALKEKLKVIYIDELICIKPKNKSTWFKGYNKEYFIARGAIFYRLSSKLYLLLILQFAIRKKEKYKENLTMIETIKCMIQGAKKYKESIKYKNNNLKEK